MLLVGSGQTLNTQAFSSLGDRYGDEERVLVLRVAKLKKLGTVPERYCDQVIFFINLEAKVQDILDL